MLCFGSYIIPDLRSSYEFHRLVNDRQREVSAIYLNERHRSTIPIRVGVTCRQSSSVYFLTMDNWNEAVPISSPATSPQVDPWYFSKANVSLFKSFQTCETDLNRCIGLLLHGDHGSRTLGQWRWDKRVSDIKDLPTSLVLVNASDGNLPYVYVDHNDIQQLSSYTAIGGILEWWTGPKGSQVFQAQTGDPFLLL